MPQYFDLGNIHQPRTVRASIKGSQGIMGYGDAQTVRNTAEQKGYEVLEGWACLLSSFDNVIATNSSVNFIRCDKDAEQKYYVTQSSYIEFDLSHLKGFYRLTGLKIGIMEGDSGISDTVWLLDAIDVDIRLPGTAIMLDCAYKFYDYSQQNK